MSSPTTVRSLERKDLQEVVELCREHAEYERSVWLDKDRQDALGELLLDSRDRFAWVVETPTELAGFATVSLELSTWDAGRYLHLDCLYLRESYRGQRLGLELMKRAASTARQQGAVNLQWQTPSWNVDAVGFYERLGARAQEKLRFTLDLAGCDALAAEAGGR